MEGKEVINLRKEKMLFGRKREMREWVNGGRVSRNGGILSLNSSSKLTVLEGMWVTKEKFRWQN